MYICTAPSRGSSHARRPLLSTVKLLRGLSTLFATCRHSGSRYWASNKWWSTGGCSLLHSGHARTASTKVFFVSHLSVTDKLIFVGVIIRGSILGDSFVTYLHHWALSSSRCVLLSPAVKHDNASTAWYFTPGQRTLSNLKSERRSHHRKSFSEVSGIISSHLGASLSVLTVNWLSSRQTRRKAIVQTTGRHCLCVSAVSFLSTTRGLHQYPIEHVVSACCFVGEWW